MSQQALARLTGWPQSKVSKIESGAQQMTEGDERLLELAFESLQPGPRPLDSYPSAPPGSPAPEGLPINSKQTPEHRNERRRYMDRRNEALQELEPIPVPTTATFAKGAEGSGRSRVRFDPETGNVVGHGHDCLCELCDPIGRKAALREAG